MSEDTMSELRDASSQTGEWFNWPMVVACLNWAAQRVHANAAEKGFWEPEPPFGVSIALMHSELSEALEANRHGSPPSDHIPEFTGEEEELADTLIRILDNAAGRRLRVAEALVAKHEFNRSRPHKHGGKAF
jgi:hypothetical protein